MPLLRQRQSETLWVAYAGFAAALFQIILLRNIMVSFYGNEFTVGIALGIWLVSSALGSFVARITGAKFRRGLFLLWSVVMALCVLAIYALQNFVPVPSGALYSPWDMLRFIVVFVLPVAFFSGFVFISLINRLHQELVIARMYYIEAIGSSLAGFLFGFLLIRFLSDVQIVILAVAIGLAVAEYYILLACFVLLLFLYPPRMLENWLNNLRWKGYEQVRVKNSYFQNITVAERAGEKLLFTDGLLNFSTADERTAEYIVHLPVSMALHHRKILVLQNLTIPMAQELGKYTDAQITYVELDAEYWKSIEKDVKKYIQPVVRITDPYVFLKRAEHRYDVIILNTPPPLSIQYNRFYTKDFFRRASKKLTPGGVFSFHFVSNPNAYTEAQLRLFGLMYQSLKDVFAKVFVLPGELNVFIGGDKNAYIGYSLNSILHNLELLGVERKYLQDYYLFDELNSFRVKAFLNLIKRFSAQSTLIKPLPFLYSLQLWNQMFSEKYRLNLFTLDRARIIKRGVFVLTLLLVIWLIARLNYTVATAYSVAITGFSEMAFQMLTIFLYQIKFGYVYSKMIIIFASFMLGLILGARFMENRRIELKQYRLLQGAIMFYPLALLVVYFLPNSALVEHFLLPFLPIIPGFFGGVQFPAAVQIATPRHKISAVTGEFYAYDLIGAFLGAVLMSLVIVPHFGIVYSALLLFALNFFALVLLFLSVEY